MNSLHLIAIRHVSDDDLFNTVLPGFCRAEMVSCLL